MPLRILAAAAVLVSAAVHLYLWFDGVREQGVVGDAFMVNAVAGAVIAVLLLAWTGHWLPALLTLGFGASTLAAFVISTTVGLFGVHAHWEGWPAWTSAVVEVVAIVAGAVLLMQWLSRRRPQHDPSVGGAHLH